MYAFACHDVHSICSLPAQKILFVLWILKYTFNHVCKRKCMKTIRLMYISYLICHISRICKIMTAITCHLHNVNFSKVQ